jgi:hypothetical protein
MKTPLLKKKTSKKEIRPEEDEVFEATDGIRKTLLMELQTRPWLSGEKKGKFSNDMLVQLDQALKLSPEEDPENQKAEVMIETIRTIASILKGEHQDWAERRSNDLTAIETELRKFSK